MIRVAAVSVAALLWAAAPVAQAQSDRAAAKAFGRAAQQLRAAAVARRQVIETGVNRLTRDPVCKDALAHVPLRAYGAAEQLVLTYQFEALFNPIVPALRAYVGKLDRVKVRDTRLRSGRAALRRGVRVASGFKPAPADICSRLHGWEQAGYPASGAPAIDDPAFDALLKIPQSTSKKVDRAVKRLRALGVSRRRAQWFTADVDTLYAGFDLDNAVAIGEQAG